MKYLLSFIILLNASSVFSMQTHHRLGMKILPVNNTDSKIHVSGMTGVKPRLGEERPWVYENFGPKSEKKAAAFLINHTMRIETAAAIFKVMCPAEMPGWLFAFGKLKATQEKLIAEKIQFSLNGKSRIKIIINDDNVKFENLPRKEYVPKELKTQNQLFVVFGN